MQDLEFNPNFVQNRGFRMVKNSLARPIIPL